MRLTLKQLRYVCEVARLGSVQGAAKALFISQSSILAAISRAEEELGARIFNRRPARGVVITPAGSRFVSAARSMLAAENEFERSLGDLSHRMPKVLRIGCFEPFGAMFMPDVLQRYIAEAGDVEIVLKEGDQEQLREWLANGTIDFAIMYDIGPAIIESTTRICKVPAHAVLHVDDPLVEKSVISISDLALRPLILLDLPETATYLLTLFDVLAKRPEVRFHTRSYETVRAAVASGFGISILNMRPIGRATADSPHIVRRPIQEDLPPPTLIVADAYGNEKPMFVRMFIDIFKRYFKDIGPQEFSVSVPERQNYLLVGN